MALYLGNKGKQKINLNGNAYYLNLFSSTLMLNGIRLLTSDDYLLRDCNGLYLTAKDGE